MKTCTFTGHRPQHLPFGMNEDDERCTDLKETLKEQIINLIEAEDVTHFITGMALGVDLYAAEIVLDLKACYPNITLESAIPCETQAVKWSMAQREHYYDIAAQCDKETMLQSHYSPGCMDKRNRYMVDRSDSIIVTDPVTLAVERLYNTQKSGVSFKAGGNREGLFASEKSLCYPAIIWMMNLFRCSVWLCTV